MTDSRLTSVHYLSPDTAGSAAYIEMLAGWRCCSSVPGRPPHLSEAPSSPPPFQMRAMRFRRPRRAAVTDAFSRAILSSSLGSSVFFVNPCRAAFTDSRSDTDKQAPRPCGGGGGRATGSPAPPCLSPACMCLVKNSGGAPLPATSPVLLFTLISEALCSPKASRTVARATAALQEQSQLSAYRLSSHAKEHRGSMASLRLRTCKGEEGGLTSCHPQTLRLHPAPAGSAWGSPCL